MADEDKSVPELLLSWGLPPEVIQRFIDADVSVKCLALIEDDLLKKLIEKEGPLMLFRLGHKTWVKELDASLKRKLENEPSDISKKQKLTSAESSHQSSSKDESTPDAPTSKSTPTPKLKLSISKDEPSVNELHNQLKDVPQGKLVIATYNKFGMLDSHTRDILAGVVIFAELGITVKRFQELTRLITQLFPNEIEDTWTEITHRKKRCIVSRRLRHKFYNIRRDFIRVALINKVTLLSELDDDEELGLDENLEEDDNILWLKANDHPWGDVQTRWEESASIRKQLVSKYGPEDYVKYFPCLTKIRGGHELLVIDFERKSPGTNQRFAHWPAFLSHIRFLLEKKVKNFFSLSTSTEEVQVQILCNIASVFRPRNIPKPPKSKLPVWKPSSTEVQNAFILRIDEIAHLRQILNDRKETLLKFGHTLQPLVVLIGSTKEIRQSLVVLNSQYWDCGLPLKAVDICFKIFFSLDTVYPVEARHLWLTVQRCVYNLETKDDFSNDTGLKTYTASYINDFKVRSSLQESQ